MLVRVIDYTIDDGRENPTGYRLFTTLLDPAEATAVDLAAAYAQRWEIELDLRRAQDPPARTPHRAALEVPRPGAAKRSGATCAATTRSAP